MKSKTHLLLIVFLLFPFIAFSQNGLQLVKGSVIDQESQIPLIGATVEVLSTDPILGSTTDVDGYFSVSNIPVGRHQIRISYLGYNSITLPDVLVTSGKEVVVNISLEESIVQMKEIVITAEVEKDQANNEMAAVSARSFTLEEVTRYSGGRNDASRMAANYAGVNISNDSRNDLVIRGNSPTGVLWRLEGVAIPNPNHFSTLGTTGGPVSALNTNLLSNSDFLTGAFPAEYGNANAGVFDIGFRNGNKDKFEVTAQLAAFSGMEAMIEGPINSKNNGSFIVSFRNSFVELAHEVGLDVGTAALPRYRDLSFKIDLGYGKAGRFSLFGIGGTSDIEFLANEIEMDDFFAQEGQDSYADSKIGVIGLNHQILLNDKSYLKTTLAASTAQNTFDVDEVNEDESKLRTLEIDDQNTRYTFSSFLNHKFNARHTIRTGLIAEIYNLKAFGREVINDEWSTFRDFDGALPLYQAYAQSKYKMSSRFVLNTGLHLQYFSDNENLAVEPRAALKYVIDNNQALTLGFGVHHQVLPLPLYLQESIGPNGEKFQSNTSAKFSRSLHYVLAYDRKFGTDWRFKGEFYYQALSNIPVEPGSNSFSVLNIGDDFGFPTVENLVNEGSGFNYGFEWTVEKFFSKGYYTLLTGSIYDSKYKGSNGVERNTAFNNKYVVNILAGKEFKIGKEKRNAITYDFKFTNAGGRHYTPIDLAASNQFGLEIKEEQNAYTRRHDPYMRLDMKIGIQLNSKKRKFAQQFYLDFQNITDNKNVFVQRYSPSEKSINTIYQIGFFPDVLYRIQF